MVPAMDTIQFQYHWLDRNLKDEYENVHFLKMEFWVVSSVGRAVPLQGIGRRFEPVRIYQINIWLNLFHNSKKLDNLMNFYYFYRYKLTYL